jgi:thiamine biosynthesis lipoprotein
MSTVDQPVAIAERTAIGTAARVVVWPAPRLATAVRAVDEVLAQLDLQASRFRPDSELSRIHGSGGGLFFLSDGLAEAVAVAVAAARWSHGLVDPTVGSSLVALGYDRDFAALTNSEDVPLGPEPQPAPGWGSVRLEGRFLYLPPDVQLDLGATAKALGSDRAVRAALGRARSGTGVLVSLGGDIAVAGEPPVSGWPVLVADDDNDAAAAGSCTQVVRLERGALATSSVNTRRWRQAGLTRHHIVDPTVGLPAAGPWRSASVAAWSCAEANAASTAALVAGPAAEAWLESTALPARLVAHNGAVRLFGGWPDTDGGLIELSGSLRGPVSTGTGPWR